MILHGFSDFVAYTPKNPETQKVWTRLVDLVFCKIKSLKVFVLLPTMKLSYLI